LAEGRTRVGGATHLVGVVGWPVDHSLSPIIHNTAFIALDMDWVYVPLPVEPGRLADALAGLTALGFAGANVTMPHKTETADLVADLSEDAVRLRAVNTLVATTSGLAGHNTDAPGFERFLSEDAGFEADGRSALLFGGGGAARACALALARSGAATIVVALRDPAKSEGLRAAVSGFATELEVFPAGANMLEGDVVWDTDWTVVIPGRGSLFLYEREHSGELGSKVISPTLKTGELWVGDWTVTSTVGPRPDRKGRIVGGTGEFAKAAGWFTETIRLTKYTKEGAMFGTVELKVQPKGAR